MASGNPGAVHDQALKLSFDDILQHLLVQTEVRHQSLEANILFLKLLQPLHLRRHQSTIFAAPSIIGLDRYSRFATNFLNRRSILCLLQYERHLLFTEPTLVPAKIYWLTNAKPNRDFSHKKWTNLKGAGHSA